MYSRPAEGKIHPEKYLQFFQNTPFILKIIKYQANHADPADFVKVNFKYELWINILR